MGAPGGPRNSRRPALAIVLFFGSAIGIGSVLLSLPLMRQGDTGFRWLDAVFTATSAVTVTGLTVVDTATAWTPLGQVVILVLIQIGGLGLATSGTLLLLVISRRLGISTRLVAQSETSWAQLGEIRAVLWFVLRVTASIEAAVAVVLALRWWFVHGFSPGEAAWQGVFTSVSSFNNAGFALFSDSLISYNEDPVVLGAVMAAIVLGGLGFPVFYQLRGLWRQPRRWSMHVRLTLQMTLGLIVLGAVALSWFEWTNPDTLGGKSTGFSVLNGLFASVTARTAGFNAIDYGAATEETLVLTSFLMFIGGGSASTAGGIKVTTFVVLALIVLAEARGSRDVTSRDRRIPEATQRAAVAIATVYFSLTATGLMLLLAVTDIALSDLLFETVSAIATVGLSTGITATLPDSARIVLVLLMFVGRLGALTTATVLALNTKRAHYRLPEGRPIIG